MGRSYFWPCLWLCLLLQSSCGVDRHLDDIAKALFASNAECHKDAR